MNVTPETVAAVNACLHEQLHFVGANAELADGCLRIADLTPEQVAALLLALSKCEPVSIVVEAANDLHEMLTAVGGPRSKASERVQRLAAALAPFAEVANG